MHVVGVNEKNRALSILQARRVDVLSACRRFGFDDVRVHLGTQSSTPPSLVLNAGPSVGLLALCMLDEVLEAVLGYEIRTLLRGSASAEAISDQADPL